MQFEVLMRAHTSHHLSPDFVSYPNPTLGPSDFVSSAESRVRCAASFGTHSNLLYVLSQLNSGFLLHFAKLAELLTHSNARRAKNDPRKKLPLATLSVLINLMAVPMVQIYSLIASVKNRLLHLLVLSHIQHNSVINICRATLSPLCNSNLAKSLDLCALLSHLL
ncbi:hypothetical protein Pst134EB_018304 [Puccinia striiformis f. sp. tritici]|nr:hypothetical protein Pst134EB_018304 [Puccinia striiformis f. sp. tritici]